MTIYIGSLRTTNLCSQISAWWVIASFRTLHTYTSEFWLHNLAIYLLKFPLPVLFEYSTRYSNEYSSNKLLDSCSPSSGHTVQRCVDPEMLRPHQSADSDHRSASATASAGRCCLGSAVSPRVRDSHSDSDPCLHLIGLTGCPRFGVCWGVFVGATWAK